MDLTKAVRLLQAGKAGSVVLGEILAAGTQVLLVFDALPSNMAQGAVTVIQEEGGKVIGGSTYVVRRVK
jgi:hypothetical protein